MDTAYIIIIAGVTGAIGMVLFTIHLIQGARQGQTLARIALAMDREAQVMSSTRDTPSSGATSPPLSPVRQVRQRLAEATRDSAPPSSDTKPGATSSAEVSEETPAASGDDEDEPDVREPRTATSALAGGDDWPARGLVDGVWRELRTLSALALGAEGTAAAEDLDLAEHLGPTLEGLAGRLEVALNDLHAYPDPPPLPARKDSPRS